MKKTLVLAIVAGMLLSLTGAGMAESISVVPGLKGFGVDTRAAYGNNQNPEIYIVDTLNPTTALTGSTRLDTDGNPVNVYEGGFKSCVEDDNDNKLIIFEVSGYIDVQGVVKSDNDCITIAGQTAPAPGVTIKHCILHINGQHILLHHLRLRQGYFDYNANWNYKDVVNLGWGGMAGNFVMDHCSLSWAMDETIGAYLGSSLNPPCLSPDGSNLTFSNNIFGEPYHKADPDDPDYIGRNFLLSCRDNVAIIKNLFISGYKRNPVIHTAGTYVVNNNLIYNPGDYNFHISNLGGAIKITAIGNVAKKGLTSNYWASYERFPSISDIHEASEIYLYDNKDETGAPGSADDWTHVRLYGGQTADNIKVLDPPVIVAGYEPIPSSQLENELSGKIGAYPAFRDAVDIRFFSEVASNGTEGRFVTGRDGLSVSDWPVLTENTRTLVLPANPHADNDSDGYTNLEEWLHAYAAEVEGANPDPDINNDGKVDLEDFAALAVWWDDENACSSPDWCQGADFDMSGTVDMLDLTYFAENWLRQTW